MRDNGEKDARIESAHAMLTRRGLFEFAGAAIATAVLPPFVAFAKGSASQDSPAQDSAAQDTPTQVVSPVMEKLSSYMSEAAERALPDEVVEKAKQHILDTLAAMISGSGLLPGRAALGFIRSYGGKEVATVAASNIVCGPIEAALTNGVLAHSDETDDSHGPSRSHPGVSIVPAALAAGEQFGISGTQFLRAVTLGYDVGTRVTMSMGGPAYEALTHRSTHGTVAVFGAGAAAGCAARLNTQQCRFLLDYSAQQVSGFGAWKRDDVHMEKAFLFGGKPAAGAVTAAMLVRSGFTGVEDIFSGPDNFFEAFAPRENGTMQADPSQLVEKLGERYEITRTNIKKWTVGSPIQAPLDALTGFFKQRTFTADDVKRVTVRLATDEVNTVSNREMPDICLQYLVAIMLLDKTVTFASVHNKARMQDPAVLRQRAKVELVSDPRIDARRPRREAIVELTFTDGTQLTDWVRDVRGTAENPMSRDEVVAKARGLITPVLGEASCSTLIDKVFALESMKDIRELRPALQRT
ncbi:MAG TPA: MmgE/PrpD family protein [Acidobacteriaceae bacterium]|nr:MmgE/PrpD family protein [Acidobacteriaceae bacterium]